MFAIHIYFLRRVQSSLKGQSWPGRSKVIRREEKEKTLINLYFYISRRKCLALWISLTDQLFIIFDVKSMQIKSSKSLFENANFRINNNIITNLDVLQFMFICTMMMNQAILLDFCIRKKYIYGCKELYNLKVS